MRDHTKIWLIVYVVQTGLEASYRQHLQATFNPERLEFENFDSIKEGLSKGLNVSYTKLALSLATKGVDQTLDELSGSWTPIFNMGKAIITRNPMHISATILILGAAYYRKHIKNKAQSNMNTQSFALPNYFNTIDLKATEIEDRSHEITKLYSRTKLSKMSIELRNKHLIGISHALNEALAQAASVKCADGSRKNQRRIITNLRRRLERAQATASAFGIDVGRSGHPV